MAFDSTCSPSGVILAEDDVGQAWSVVSLWAVCDGVVLCAVVSAGGLADETMSSGQREAMWPFWALAAAVAKTWVNGCPLCSGVVCMRCRWRCISVLPVSAVSRVVELHSGSLVPPAISPG
eukprot:scaffold55220_cov19-Prasinocladus_malaysianus.AAC.2